ncbi:MAG: DUF1571 domain-containing protein [Armatimonadetes bacterium]|nr:DUF1571 domain-containing protein [Armatimonadota bacterium]
MQFPGRVGPALACGVLMAGLSALAGCRGPQANLVPRPAAVKGLSPAEADVRAEAVRRDPVGYLHRVAFKCQNLNQYTLKFTRCERRGLLQQLFGPEHIMCWFRRRPFSVRMKWLNTDMKYDESGYVAGEADSKVRFVTRWWSPPLLPPPGVNKVDLQTPVIFGESKRPMTDFGLERLMERTLDSLHKAGEDVVVTYEGLAALPEGGPTVHHLRLEYPAARYRVPIQEIYIDIVTDLPAGTILRLASGEIDASYFYADLDANVRLTDADFLLEAERAAAKVPASPAPKTK